MSNESFDDDTVIELEPTAHAGNSSQPSALDTFDNDEPMALEKSAAKMEKKSAIENLEDDEDEDKSDEKPKEEKKVAEKEDEKKEEIPVKTGDKPGPVSGKSLRLKDENGTATDVSEDATVKVKVNGRNEFVPLKELRDNYSGKVAWENKFNEIKEEKSQVETKSKQFETERNQIVSHLTKIADMLDSDDKNPLEALHYLVDITGRDTLQFSKKVMEYLSEEVHNLDSMDDVERQLYWKNKEVDTIRSNQAARAENLKNTEAEKERITKIDQLRESHGVTENDFVKSHRELKELGYDDKQITPEAIVNYTVMKPHFEKAESLVEPYEQDLGDSEIETLISTVANTMRNYPRISEQKALEVALESLGWDYDYEEDDFKEINEKATKKAHQATQKVGHYEYGRRPEQEKAETFDDWD